MADLKSILLDCSGGRNGFDPPYALGPNQCAEATNVDWFGASLGRKRPGTDAISLSGGTAFTGVINRLIRYVPASDETAAELWAIDAAATPVWHRLKASTSWADVTVDDAITSKAMHTHGATLNGKLFLAYWSGVDRLHCYDPNLASPKVRRVGIAPGSSAPTVANGGGVGTYAATLRYYRVRFIEFDAATTTIVVRRSEPTPSVSFTPDGAHVNATITRPTAPGEGETHWEVEASTDNVTFYRIYGPGATTAPAIGTTTATDTLTTSQYSSDPLSDATGTYSLPTGVRFVVSDGNRLLLAGTTQSGLNNRVWWTPVLGSGTADDERVSTALSSISYTDLEENSGDTLTGLGGPIGAGVVYAFMRHRTWRLTPTGDATTPYLQRKISATVGAVNQQSICRGLDQYGQAALYFLDVLDGPYRISNAGVEWCGYDVQDIWKGLFGKTAFNAAATNMPCWTEYYPDLHQVWFHLATSGNDPDTRLVLDVNKCLPDGNGRLRGGWSVQTGVSVSARCGVLFAKTLGATMGYDLGPYAGTTAGTLHRCDSPTGNTNDGGTNFNATVKSRVVLPPSALGAQFGVGEPVLLATAQSNTTITLTLTKDFGKETRTSSVSLALLTEEGSATRVVRKFEGAALADANVFQVTIGDFGNVASAWTLDALYLPIETQGGR